MPSHKHRPLIALASSNAPINFTSLSPQSTRILLHLRLSTKPSHTSPSAPPNFSPTAPLRTLPPVRDEPIFVQCTGETPDLSDMAHAKGTGLDTRKQCLPGTCTKILSQITNWINDSGDAAQRILWLSGPAARRHGQISDRSHVC
ncbi:hypothetical protein DFH29DRAFT_997480 [Suillus ampliporus]|nr:hypothetical protein DFH29DRAFT_997480 [Suillus ampliporus]